MPASVRANTLLKQLAAHAQETATEDQAADHTAQNEMQRVPFELNVTESVPTSDQFKTIMEYVGAQRASQLVAGARDETDALQRLKQDPTSFTPPLVGFKYNLKTGTDRRPSIGITDVLVSTAVLIVVTNGSGRRRCYGSQEAHRSIASGRKYMMSVDSLSFRHRGIVWP